MSTNTFHGQPGDAIADWRNIPGIVLFIAGVVALASTVTAAGDGAHGWMIAGAIATVMLFVAAIGIFVAENHRVRHAVDRLDIDGRQK